MIYIRAGLYAGGPSDYDFSRGVPDPPRRDIETLYLGHVVTSA